MEMFIEKLQELNLLLILIFGGGISAGFKMIINVLKKQAEKKRLHDKRMAEDMQELKISMRSISDDTTQLKVDYQQITDTLEIHQQSNVAVLHNKLYKSCNEYITRKWVTSEELNDLEYLYKSYKKQGGNGTGDTLWRKVNDLDIKGGY